MARWPAAALLLLAACAASLLLASDAAIHRDIIDHNTEISGLRREDLLDSLQSTLQGASRSFGFDVPSVEKIAAARKKLADAKAVPHHESWVKSGNVAAYNGLHEQPYLNMPNVLNLVFIGFEGDGHHGLHLKEKDLQSYFEHMEHLMPHVKVVPHDRSEPSPTHIYHQYHYRVIEFDPNVNAVLEAVIWENARLENPWAEKPEPNPRYFVDVTALTDVLDTVVESLELDETATLFILNPKLPHPGFKYGYRYGFSAAELQRLRENMPLLLELQKRDPPRPLPDFPDVVLHEDDAHTSNKTHHKFAYKSLRNESLAWSEIYMAAMHDVSYWKRHPAEEAWGNEESDNPKPEDAPPPPADMLFEVAATKLLQSHDAEDLDYIRSVLHPPYATPNCVVDSWVADKRYAFIDLSAGPFEWGPIVGGEGVKTKRSLPDVGDLVLALRDFSHGGAWNDTAYVHKIEKQLRKHGAGILEKEEEVIKAFLNEQCNGLQDSPGEIGSCKSMRHKLKAVETFLAHHKTTTVNAMSHLALLTGSPLKGRSEMLVLQAFFSKLGDIIRSTARLLVTPAASSLPIEYAQKVNFHLYIIRNHNSYTPDDKENFDFDQFKTLMSDAAMPRQRFTFTISRHTLAEDPHIAMAYARSIRSAVVGSLRPDGRFESTKRMYLDSSILQEHMRRAQRFFSEARGKEDLGAHSKTIPIFMFSLDYPMPIFIDKYLQARAMEDMVVAVQTDDRAWPSHLSCNGEPVVWNLRHPLRAVLSATLQHLAGVLPTHLTRNGMEPRTAQNWFWSVGMSPHAQTATTPGNFSQFQIDAAHRNQILESLSHSLETSNAAIRVLKAAKTGAGSEAVFSVVPNDRIVQLHISIKKSWKQIAVSLRHLRFSAAIPLVHSANRNAQHLLDIAEEIALYLNVDSCTRPSAQGSTVDIALWLAVAMAASALGVYVVYKPRNLKPKLV